MNKHRREIIGVLLIVLSILVFLSLFTYNPSEEPTISESVSSSNFMGIVGIYISYYLIKMTIGWGSFVFPILLAILGFGLVSRRNIKSLIRPMLYLFGLGIWTSTALGIYALLKYPVNYSFTHSGLVGGISAKFIHDFVGTFSTILIISICIILIIIGFFRLSIHDAFTKLKNWIQVKFVEFREKRRIKKLAKSKEPIPVPIKKEELGIETEPESIEVEVASTIPTEETEAIEQEDAKVDIHKEEEIDDFDERNIEIEEMDEIEEGDLDALKERKARYRQYKLPSIELLKSPPPIMGGVSEETLQQKAQQLEHALQTFGVIGKVRRISPGPVITLFEIEPAEGVRVNKFVNLSDDLARIMRAQRIRVIAPIPGSHNVGIELPNDDPEIVYLKSIINSEKYINSKSKLTLAAGKTTTGDAYVFDLAKMPHILVAGATGSGKSVCINTIIISILYKAKPDEVKFIMMDPKKLELSSYKSLVGHHLITSPNIDEYVMTTPENAVAILNAAIVEMERRYQLFADVTVRNIGEYHSKCKQNSEMEKVPYVVVIIDELADLMMTSGKDIEEPITRLAQMARAVGIHLVVATQRPSVDVITGLIKANFPARIAFQVSQKVDSRTIIDQMGAEKLLGNGDMLFLPPGTSAPIRLHNAFIELDEIEDIMSLISSQPKPEEIHLPEVKKKTESSDFSVDGERDELFMDAAKLVIQNQQASVSLLQRKFRIGYSRAGRLIDEMEAMGIISGFSGSKAREVLVDSTYLENIVE
ncbi:MAG: DNA translocase FtsK [Candidatus Marinimicrobia bacterium]|nr:DNA translocase FtsK [Candidatus Neomarinimicrobiota bacterium]